MRTRAALRQGRALLPVVESEVGSLKWVYSLRLLDIWVIQSSQGLRRMLKLGRSAMTEQVVIRICARNVGYITGIGVHISRWREHWQ
jgi:hypothetical protein